MPPIKNNYLVRSRQTGEKSRNWWLIKVGTNNSAYVELGRVTLTKEFIGKKVRFKVERYHPDEDIFKIKNTKNLNSVFEAITKISRELYSYELEKPNNDKIFVGTLVQIARLSRAGQEELQKS